MTRSKGGRDGGGSSSETLSAGAGLAHGASIKHAAPPHPQAPGSRSERLPSQSNTGLRLPFPGAGQGSELDGAIPAGV